MPNDIHNAAGRACRRGLAIPLPDLPWLRHYESSWPRADLVAGVKCAAYLLPAGIADASLAKLPAQAGLYLCLFSGLIFWLQSAHTLAGIADEVPAVGVCVQLVEARSSFRD